MDLEKMERKLNVNFSSIQGFYWAAFCSANGFASVFLLSKNFNNSQIGIVLALANIFAVILQPIAASYADRSRKITLKQIIVTFSFIGTGFSGVLLFIPDVFFLLGMLFVLILTILLMIQPLINGLIFEFVNQGVLVNFGLTRGIGSLAYALISYFLGVMAEKIGPGIIPGTSFVLIVLLMFSLILVKDSRKSERKEGFPFVEKKSKEEKADFFEFVKNNKRFFGYLIGIMLIFIYHMMFNNYIIHIVNRAGGTSKQMGTAIFIAAMLELPVMGAMTLLLKKFGIRKLLCFSAVFFGLKACFTLIAVNIVLLYINQVFQMFSYAILLPASVYYVNQIMKEGDRVKGQAYTTGAMTAGSVIGNLLGGKIIDVLGTFSMLLTGSIAALTGMIFILIFTEKKKRKERREYQ